MIGGREYLNVLSELIPKRWGCKKHYLSFFFNTATRRNLFLGIIEINSLIKVVSEPVAVLAAGVRAGLGEVGT